MALRLVKLDEATLPGIADAIRAKTGGTGLLLPAQMAEAIAGIQQGSGLAIQTITLTTTFRSGSDGTPYTIEHGLSAVPSLFVMWRDSGDCPTTVFLVGAKTDGYEVITRTNGVIADDGDTAIAWDETSINLFPGLAYWTMTPGTYRWIAM